ncbi:MAG: hypothetical protein RMN25_06260 [Anaerolineae bacterium]|nr:hypothetical protein [Thermoflexales bacterium]MDW8407371.1 hypothetical protein [Anaerolineae bacterium]
MSPTTTPGQASARSSDPVGPAQPEEARPNTKLLIGMVAGGVLFVVVTILIIWFLAENPQRTANIRDIFIIALAFISALIGILLAILIWQLQSLIVLLRNEIKPMLINANQTVNTVRGTAVFMSDNLAKPAIKAFSFLSGLRGAANAVGARAGARRQRPAGNASAPTGTASSPSETQAEPNTPSSSSMSDERPAARSVD